MAEPESKHGTIGAIGRAEIGPAVREHFAAIPGMMVAPADRFELFLLPDFLDAEECAGLIAKIDAARLPSQVLSPTQDPDYRTSESCNLEVRDPLTIRVEAKIAALTGIDARHGETIQGQRYAPGQRFKPHWDFFLADQPYWPEQERIGGQRTWTAMIFLNEPEEGGETNFPHAGLKVQPRAGWLLAWNNLDPAGEPNIMSMHEGTPVRAGVKYIITKWYRERPWGVRH